MDKTLLAHNKALIRKKMRSALCKMDSTEKEQASLEISHTLANLLHPLLRDNSKLTVASFYALPTEPSIHPLIAQLPLRWLLPHCLKQGEMNFHQISRLSQLEVGPYNIPQPPSSLPIVSPSEIDVFLCPGIAFSPCGLRLGQGGGYYDRILNQKSPTAITIGIGFEIQILSEIPTLPHDAIMDHVLSETDFYSQRRP